MPHDICQSIAIILSNYSSYTHVTRAIFYFIRKWLRAQLRVKTHNRLRKKHHIWTNKSGVEKTKHLGTHTFAAKSECARPKWTTLRARHTGCGIARAVRAPRAHRTRVARAPRTHCAHRTRTVRAPYAHRTRTVRAPYAHRTRAARQLYARIAHCTRTPPYTYGSPLSWKALS